MVTSVHRYCTQGTFQKGTAGACTLVSGDPPAKDLVVLVGGRPRRTRGDGPSGRSPRFGEPRGLLQDMRFLKSLAPPWGPVSMRRMRS